MKKKINKITRSIKRIFTAVILIITFALTIYLYTSENIGQAQDEEIGRLNAVVAEYKTNATEENKSNIQTIIDICEEEGVDPDLALSVSAYESHLQQYFIGINDNKTVDRGIFALNSYYYASVSDECAFSVPCATRVFCQEVLDGNINNWLSVKTLGLVKK